MISKKILGAILLLIIFLVLGGIYWWQSKDSNVVQVPVPTSEVSQPEETSEVVASKSTVDEETKKQEINTDTVWKTYISKEGGISFEYPQQFFLLDRSKDDKRIYISPREISFNDFAGGYYEPIEISFKDESESNSMIAVLENKKVSQTTISDKNALVISGVVPETRPYYAFDMFAVFFPEQEISIIGANRFNQDSSTDLETVARKIAATLNFE
jgi:hypothetical protein